MDSQLSPGRPPAVDGLSTMVIGNLYPACNQITALLCKPHTLSVLIMNRRSRKAATRQPSTVYVPRAARVLLNGGIFSPDLFSFVYLPGSFFCCFFVLLFWLQLLMSSCVNK